ncbi:MAG: glycosyltransferase, partial [Erysipelotrichaceae bacterium]|nr:glycosyltransferase [Erysipelotrichaceae bacterium]
MAKVSIIIPTYNVEEYLRECMDSVVNQTLKDIEIICINDGSTDSSLSILQEYADKDDRIIIIDKQNEGYGKGMNDGLDKATGEYIGIVEPDDFVDIHMYEDLYNKAKELDLDIIKADFYRFIHPENKPLVATYNALSKDGTGYNQVVDPKEHPEIFFYIMNTWSGIYKREMIEKYHIRHNTTPGASFQDNGFWFITMTRAERVYFVDKPYYMNRRDNPNSSVKN